MLTEVSEAPSLWERKWHTQYNSDVGCILEAVSLLDVVALCS